MELVRDKSLDYSALRFSATIPITWMTGNYKLKKGYRYRKLYEINNNLYSAKLCEKLTQQL
jgi:hypothetical protein